MFCVSCGRSFFLFCSSDCDVFSFLFAYLSVLLFRYFLNCQQFGLVRTLFCFIYVQIIKDKYFFLAFIVDVILSIFLSKFV